MGTKREKITVSGRKGTAGGKKITVSGRDRVGSRKEGKDKYMCAMLAHDQFIRSLTAS